MDNDIKKMMGLIRDANTFQYFAYGSNMLSERIHINNPTAQLRGIGKLYGYRLTFEVPSGFPPSNWYGASATIRPASCKDYVYGVIWSIHIDDMAFLDTQESCYKAVQVKVELDNGEFLPCRTYEMLEETVSNALPSPHYKRVIVTGAKQHGLPEGYIQQLERFSDNGLTVVPPNYLRVIDLVAKYNMGKDQNGQISALDFNVERELLTLVKA